MPLILRIVLLQVPDENSIVTGFRLNYKLILNMGKGSSLRYGNTMSKQVPYRPLTATITGLEGYEFYEICVMATSGFKTSACSPPMIIQSGESGTHQSLYLCVHSCNPIFCRRKVIGLNS